MNKTILVITAALCAFGTAYGAKLVLDDQDATKVGLPGVVSKCNANFTELYAGTNVVAGMLMPAVNGTAITNLAGGNIAGGNIALARVTNALATAVIPVAGITNALTTGGASIGGNIPLAALTNALSPTLYSGTYTNIGADLATTNVIVVLNGVIVSMTNP